MSTNPTRAFRVLAIAIPGAAKNFENLRIDYRHLDVRPLRDACNSVGASLDAAGAHST